VTKDKRDLVLGAKIGEPVPAKDAFNANNDVLHEREHQLKEQLGIGFDIFMDPDLPLVADNADIHFSGMQIDTAIELVLLVIKSHGLASFG